MPLYIVVDACSLCAVWFGVRWPAIPLSRASILSGLPMFVVPVFVFLVLAKTYARVWSRAQVRDFAALVLAILLGAPLTSAGLSELFGDPESSLSRLTLLGAFWRPFRGGRSYLARQRARARSISGTAHPSRPESRRALAYGGGVRFKAAREIRSHAGINDRVIIRFCSTTTSG